MIRLITILCLGASLALPVSARADDSADRVAAATALVTKTLIKNLETGFKVAVDKTVASMPAPRAEAVRKELGDAFERQRVIMVDGLSKEYAQRFTLPELKHLDEIYADPTYLKFQALNGDPNSPVSAISQGAVTKLLNMLAVASAADNAPQPDATPTPMPPPAATPMPR